jgi:hypothetical protein
LTKRLGETTQALQQHRAKLSALEKQQLAQVAAKQELESKLKEQEVALQVALTGSKPADSTNSSELADLEAKLNAKHLEEIQKLRESIASEQASKPVDQGVADSSAAAAELAKAREELETLRQSVETLQKEKEEAKAQGIQEATKELSIKMKIKDTQISKLTKRLQDCEVLLASANGSVAPSPVTANAAPSPAAATPTTATAAATPSAPATTESSGTSATPVAAAAPAAARGRGAAVRGAAVRGSVVRGAARGRGVGRGAAPANAAGSAAAGPVTPAQTTAPAGTSILGAATKRARESEGEPAADSLAKRLKPGPVTLNRPKPPPEPAA